MSQSCVGVIALGCGQNAAKHAAVEKTSAGDSAATLLFCARVELMVSKSDKQWQADQDARSIAEAAAVQTDPARLKAAQAAAKRLATEEKQRAAEATARSKAMAKLASKPKPAAKPKAKPRRR